MRISDWSSDVCSSDLDKAKAGDHHGPACGLRDRAEIDFGQADARILVTIAAQDVHPDIAGIAGEAEALPRERHARAFVEGIAKRGSEIQAVGGQFDREILDAAGEAVAHAEIGIVVPEADRAE